MFLMLRDFDELSFRMLSTDGDTGIKELYELIADPNIETALRQADLYAAIIEYYAANNNYKSALGTLQEMKQQLPKVYFICFIIIKLIVS